MRLNGSPDLSKLNDAQKELFYKMQKEYTLLKQNKKLDSLYNKYLTQVWKSFKEAEEKNLLSAILPDLPSGIPKILSVENLLKLEKINCKKLLQKC